MVVALAPARDHAVSMRGFISYRRGDSQAEANGLLDGLRHRLPEWKLYMDVDSIPGGVDFEEHIRQEIESCDVVLVVIGPDWLDVRPENDIRRIEADGDYVRLEIECALTAPSATVIPVLVGGAEMPMGAELPDSIRGLARRNAVARPAALECRSGRAQPPVGGVGAQADVTAKGVDIVGARVRLARKIRATLLLNRGVVGRSESDRDVWVRGLPSSHLGSGPPPRRACISYQDVHRRRRFRDCRHRGLDQFVHREHGCFRTGDGRRCTDGDLGCRTRRVYVRGAWNRLSQSAEPIDDQF